MADRRVMAEFTGTAIAPNGKRYASGAPELLEDEEAPLPVRATGERAVGAVPTIDAEGNIVWAMPEGGSVAIGGGIGREVIDPVTFEGFPTSPDGQSSYGYNSLLFPETTDPSAPRAPWVASDDVTYAIEAEVDDLNFPSTIAPLGIFTIHSAGRYELYLEVDVDTQSAPDRKVNCGFASDAYKALPRSQWLDGGFGASESFGIDSGDDGYVVIQKDAIVQAPTRVVVFINGSLNEYGGSFDPEEADWGFTVNYAEISIRRLG